MEENTNPEVISAMQRELYLEVPSFSDWNDLHALVPRGELKLFFSSSRELPGYGLCTTPLGKPSQKPDRMLPV